MHVYKTKIGSRSINLQKKKTKKKREKKNKMRPVPSSAIMTEQAWPITFG